MKMMPITVTPFYGGAAYSYDQKHSMELFNTVRACILMEIHSFITVFAADLGAHAHSLPVAHSHT